MSVINVKKLWENGELIAACNQNYPVNCLALNTGSFKDAWIIRGGGCCGNDAETSITFTNPNNVAALHGIWVESGDRGFIVDAATPADIVDKCNACCGEDTTVTPVYDGTIPAIADETVNTYCITRSDNGSYLAIQNAFLDYQGRYITMSHRSNTGGVSKYQITATAAPRAIGTDVIANGACS